MIPKSLPYLQNWSVIHSPSDSYKPPETLQHFLCGDVTNHPEIKDNSNITTSAIMRIYEEDGNLCCQTSHRVYQLGVIDPEYEAQNPNAIKRLLKVYNNFEDTKSN